MSMPSMPRSTSGARGWTFLIARGRSQGYRLVLAPDFLIAQAAHGGIEAQVPTDYRADGSATRHDVTIRGRRYCAVAASMRIAPQHVGSVTSQSSPDDKFVLDEHGRPLQLTYGFLSDQVMSLPVAESDLRTARTQALAAYRQFLADEAGFTTLPSRSFGLQSNTIAYPVKVAEDDRLRWLPWLALPMLVVVAALFVLVIYRGDQPKVRDSTPPPSATQANDQRIPAEMLGVWAGELTTAGRIEYFAVTLDADCKVPCGITHGQKAGGINVDDCSRNIQIGRVTAGFVEFTFLPPPPAAGCPLINMGSLSIMSKGPSGGEKLLMLSLPGVNGDLPIPLRRGTVTPPKALT
jgi:hypothetical protein